VFVNFLWETKKNCRKIVLIGWLSMSLLLTKATMFHIIGNSGCQFIKLVVVCSRIVRTEKLTEDIFW
jgi:hypothetical protein